MSEISQEVIDLVVANKDSDDNTILGLLIGSGVAFNKAKGTLNEILVSQGLRMTKEDRDAKAEELLTGFEATAEVTVDEVAEQIEVLQEELSCTVGIARAYVRAAFNEADIPMPKSAGAGPRSPRQPGFAGDVKIAADWAIFNPTGDYEAFKAHLESIGKAVTKTGADKSKRWWGVIEDLRIFAVQYSVANDISEAA